LSTSKVKKSSLFASAGLVSAATAFSRVLGLIREQIMAYYFGASLATDAFVAAFRIPNLLRDMFAEGALSAAFVPVFKEKLVNEAEDEAFSLARTVITAILTFVGAIVLLGIVATPVIVFISAKGFTSDPVKFDLTISLTRIMFAYLLLVSLSAMIMGMLNSFGRFGIPAFSPVLFNLGIIVTVIGFQSFFEVPIYAMAIGVLVGGLGQLLIQVPPLLRLGFRFRLRFNFLDPALKRVLKLFWPMVAGMSAGRVNILVSTLLASFLVEGSISYLSYAFRLMHFPLGVFAVALGTVALPSASEVAAKNDMKALGKTFSESINLNMFLVIPSAVFLALIGQDMVALIYQWGKFSDVDTANTARALWHYSYGLIGFAAVRVTVPFYYALKDSKLPMRVSIVTVALNLVLYYPLIKLWSFAGLAAATSIAGLVNFGLLLYFLPSRNVTVRFGHLLLNTVRIVLAAVAAVALARFVPIDLSVGQTEVIGRVLNLGAMLGIAAVLYIVFCWLLRVSEVTTIGGSILGKFSRK